MPTELDRVIGEATARAWPEIEAMVEQGLVIVMERVKPDGSTVKDYTFVNPTGAADAPADEGSMAMTEEEAVGHLSRISGDGVTVHLLVERGRKWSITTEHAESRHHYGYGEGDTLVSALEDLLIDHEKGTRRHARRRALGRVFESPLILYALVAAEFETPEEVRAATDKEIVEGCRNIGPKRLAEIRTALAARP